MCSIVKSSFNQEVEMNINDLNVFSFGYELGWKIAETFPTQEFKTALSTLDETVLETWIAGDDWDCCCDFEKYTAAPSCNICFYNGDAKKGFSLELHSPSDNVTQMFLSIIKKYLEPNQLSCVSVW